MKRKHGFTIAEIMVASGLFLILMLVGLGTLRVVQNTGDHLKGRSLPRQQLRALVSHLQHEVRAATFVYDVNATLNFGPNTSFAFLGAPPHDPNQAPARSLLMAIPESSDAATTYRISSLFLEPDTSTDAAYENSHQVVVTSTENMSGMTPGSPADIPLNALPVNRTSVKRFQTASPGDGLKMRLSESLDSLQFEFVIGHETEGEGLVFETYTAQFTMRNNR